VAETAISQALTEAVAALVDPTKLALLAALSTAAAGIAAFNKAAEQYKAAYDPPDQDFTTPAEVSPPVVPRIEAMPEGPGKALARRALGGAAAGRAASVSRDRALGAEAAGDTEWQAFQWEAAARWMGRAADLEGRLALLLRAIERPLAEANRPGGAEVLAN